MEKGRQLVLVQVPRAERYLAVATASILSRDRFLARLEWLSQKYGIELPKGASEAVVVAGKKIVSEMGAQTLRKVAKLHHRTTRKVMENG